MCFTIKKLISLLKWFLPSTLWEIPLHFLLTHLRVLACTPKHPTKPNKELRKHIAYPFLKPVSLHTYSLIYCQGKYTASPMVGTSKGSNPAILHSPEIDQNTKRLSWLSPPCGTEMFPSLICVSHMTWFPPRGHVLCEKMACAPLQGFHAI